MISLQNVTMHFGPSCALSSLSLDIPPGDSVALWGANGAGKTTLIRCILGLLRFQGSISVAGADVWKNGKSARRQIGYVPQELGFYDDLRVDHSITYFARLKAVAADPAASLRQVGLEGHEHKRVRELSGGMKQRLSLALALLGDPAILILDEVTASLDALGRDEFVALLKSLAVGGRTMLFASHRIEEVAALARRVVRLNRGSIAQILPVRDFVDLHASDAVLHVEIPLHARPRAMQCLRESGLSPVLNGVGLLVPVSTREKALPVRLLTQAGIHVDNFELVTHACAHALAHHPQESPTC